MNDDEVRTLALMLLPYCPHVEAMWNAGAATSTGAGAGPFQRQLSALVAAVTTSTW
jgi:hypothetical protein